MRPFRTLKHGEGKDLTNTDLRSHEDKVFIHRLPFGELTWQLKSAFSIGDTSSKGVSAVLVYYKVIERFVRLRKKMCLMNSSPENSLE